MRKMVLLRILATIGAAIHLFPHSVDGCGGFWCTLNQPVNQAAENILFVLDKDEVNPKDSNMTAVVQIMYDGPSEDFAWLLPVPNVPDVSVSSNAAFQRLTSATDPQYWLEQTVEGTCWSGSVSGGDAMASVGSSSKEEVARDTPQPDVEVIKEETVGPYDYVLIKVNENTEDPGKTAVTWLQDNGYDVFDETADVLGPYLEDGMMLLAFRLTKGKGVDSGAIRPVVLKYKSERPMIPIRPTAVAANDDMGIRVWVTAKHRAYPINYTSLVLNEALINWFNWRSNYNDVVIAAADQAGGQGFVTELAGPTSSVGDAIFSPFEAEWWDDYKSRSFMDGFDAIQQAMWRLRFLDGWREAVGASVTLPSGISLDDFGTDPNMYQDQVQVNLTKFLQHLETEVIEPMRMTQELFDKQPYVTRMYTTMSADEMTMDPEFDFSEKLPNISNVHNANITVHCQGDLFWWDAPWTIYLPSGGSITGQGQSFWPYLLEDMPANLQIERLSPTGASEVLSDNSEEIKGALEKGPTYPPSSSDQKHLGSFCVAMSFVASFMSIML